MHGMLRKVTFLEISRSLLFIGVAGLQYTVCNATRNELLSTFLKGVLKLIENFGEVVSKRFIIRNIQTCKLQFSTFRVFKTPEITSTVEFLSSEISTENREKYSEAVYCCNFVKTTIHKLKLLLLYDESENRLSVFRITRGVL